MDTDDIDIQRIRRSSHSELVQLWKREYDSANKELAKIRGDFYELRGRFQSAKEELADKNLKIEAYKEELGSLRERYSRKLEEAADKDLEITGLKASNKTLKARAATEADETSYWFKKASKLEGESKKQRRKSQEMMRTQHELDEEIATKYRRKSADLEEKLGDLEISNDLVRSKNMRLTETIKRLVGSADFEDIVGNKKAHYQCDTQSSLDKKKVPKISKAQKRRNSMAKVDSLLHNLEDEVRKHNVHAQLEGQRIMKKTKAAERQIHAIQMAL